jgi:hypothetical protein
MDVLCVGMYRSGSTWQYDVVCHLLETHHGGHRLGFVTGEEFADLRGQDAAGWRVLKAHDAHPAFAAALAEGQALAVYSFRDLRDVAYSLLHKFGDSFEEVIERQHRLHLCLANDAFWTDHSRTLCQRYEEIMADPAAAIEALAGHLGLELATSEAAALAEEYSLTANLWRTVELANRLRGEGVDLDDPANAQRWDAQTLMHWNHIRAGRVGGWRAEATPRELAVLAGICGGWLIARGYERDLAWAMPAVEHFRSELEATQQALSKARVELACQGRQLQQLQSLGPVALGLARRFHELSLRYPRLAATLRRVLGSPPHKPEAPAPGRPGAGASGLCGVTLSRKRPVH